MCLPYCKSCIKQYSDTCTCTYRVQILTLTQQALPNTDISQMPACQQFLANKKTLKAHVIHTCSTCTLLNKNGWMFISFDC